jgi:hypothetical protein
VPPSPGPHSVDFHFDIMCPFAFHASRCSREVRDLKPHDPDVARALLVLFGPDLVDPAHGPAASDLWDVYRRAGPSGGLRDNRPRGPAKENAMAAALAPYLGARDWISINRGEVIEFAPTAEAAEVCSP